jgi:hypothetical protein
MRRRAESIGQGVAQFGTGIRRTFRGYPFIMAGLCAVWFGLVLLCVPNTFATAQAFAAMARLASQDAWGGVMLTFGLANLVAFVVSPSRAWVAAMLLVPVFTFVAVTITVGVGRPSTGGGTYVLVAMLAGWAASERV